MQVVQRAQKEDLQQPQKYLVSFMRNNRGQVIIDRRFNTSQLVGLYLDKPVPEDVITWNPDKPNQLRMALPGLQLLIWHVALVPMLLYAWFRAGLSTSTGMHFGKRTQQG